jgi:hypothetical protein
LITDIVGPSFDPEAARLVQVQALVFVCASGIQTSSRGQLFFSDPLIAPIKKQPAQNLPLYELKITLRGSNPAIWRRVQVPGSINLNRLHDVFQVVMGWTDSHLHQFVDAPIVYSVPSGDDYPGEERLDERRFCLADVARHEKASFIYEYDFGDSWAHEVVVEKTLSADPKKKYAICLD